MFHFLIGSLDPKKFHFDSDQLVSLASARWPEAEVYQPASRLAGRVEVSVSFPASVPDSFDSVLEVKTGGEAISIDTTSQDEAARIMAWLAGTLDLPSDGTVFASNWGVEAIYPLRPGITEEQLMADCIFNF